jgi:hypothetical protein
MARNKRVETKELVAMRPAPPLIPTWHIANRSHLGFDFGHNDPEYKPGLCGLSLMRGGPSYLLRITVS